MSEDAAAAPKADEGLGENGDRPVQQIPLYIQLPLLAVAVACLIVSVFPDAPESWRPQIDATALGSLAAVAVFSVLHLIRQISLPGGGGITLAVERRAAQAAVTASAASERTAGAYSRQLESWTNAVATLNEHLVEQGTDAQNVARIVQRFCIERMEEARTLVALPQERVRVSVWWYFATDGGLRLTLSDDIRDERTLNFVFEPGEGLLGQAFVEGRLYNLADVRASAYYVEIRPDYPYRGLMLVPIKRANVRILGVLSIDREHAREFTSEDEHVGLALADLIAIAYTHPAARAYLPTMSPDAPAQHELAHELPARASSETSSRRS